MNAAQGDFFSCSFKIFTPNVAHAPAPLLEISESPQLTKAVYAPGDSAAVGSIDDDRFSIDRRLGRVR